jgi:hypothetical protein
MKTVVGLFRTPIEAHHALDDLRAAGYHPQHISVIASPSGAGELAREVEIDAPATTAGAASFGAVLGGAAGWLVGIGALAIPGIGPVVAAGPIAAALGAAGAATVTAAGTALAGASVGAIAGGLFGALTAWGFSEAEAREYEARVARGDTLLAVEIPDGATMRAEEILQGAGADRFGSSGSVIG